MITMTGVSRQPAFFCKATTAKPSISGIIRSNTIRSRLVDLQTSGIEPCGMDGLAAMRIGTSCSLLKGEPIASTERLARPDIADILVSLGRLERGSLNTDGIP